MQRLCGICPVSHHLAAAKATDQLVGADTLTPTAEKIRRLMHYGQIFQSHALHFFYLSSPDMLFGLDDPVRHRSIVGVIQDAPDIAKQGILMRRFGQEVIRLTAGKRIHGTGAVPGGVNEALIAEGHAYLAGEVRRMIAWSQTAVELVRCIYLDDAEHYQAIGRLDANTLSLTGPNGGHELYHGGLHAR